MDINQNQQINTFLKGMNTDTSDMLINEQLYRYAENIRLITNVDNNSGEIRLAEGNTPILSFTGKVLSFDSIRNYIVLVLKYKKNNVDTWGIYTLNVEANPAQNTLTKVFESEEHIWPENWNGGDKPISTLLRWESEENIKLYIADGIHSLMCANIAHTYENTTFDQLFKYQETIVPAPQVLIYGSGYINAAVVQYAYRWYKENGGSTEISMLSVPLSLYKTSNTGIAPDKLSNKSVQVTIPNTVSTLNKLQIYRICYVQMGQLPTVDLCYEGDTVTSFIDEGVTKIKQMSAPEFLALHNLWFTSHIIESKGNHLFCANISYQQDSVDKDFENFDAVIYSRDITTDAAGNTSVIPLSGDITFPAIGTTVYSKTASNHYEYNADYWGDITVDGHNYQGVGKNFFWEFVEGSYTLPVINDANYQRTYRRGEVYRFGVRLFNKEGHASSVKWMCDIQIPTSNPISISSNTITATPISIKFTPRTDSGDWNDISGYEIVQAKRTMADRFTITQGIVGNVHETGFYHRDATQSTKYKSDYLTPVGYMSLDNIYATIYDFDYYVGSHEEEGLYGNTVTVSDGHCIGIKIPTSNDGDDETILLVLAKPSSSVIQFASPESVYQQDDIKNLINTYKNSDIHLKTVINYIPQSEALYTEVTPNNDIRDSIMPRIYDDENSQYVDNFTKGRIYFVKSPNKYSYAVGIYDHIGLSLHNGYDYIINPYTSRYNLFDKSKDVPAVGGGASNTQSFIDGIFLLNDISFGDVSASNYIKDSGSISTNLNDEYQHILYIDNAIVRQQLLTDQTRTVSYFNYLTPERIDNIESLSLNIKDFVSIESPDYSDYFTKDKNYQFKNKIVGIDGKSFVNWTNPFACSEQYIPTMTEFKNTMDNQDGEWRSYISLRKREHVMKCYPIASGGKGFLFKVDSFNRSAYVTSLQTSNMLDRMPLINVMNLCKPSIPYGGFNKQAFEQSTYLSVGGSKEIVSGADNSVTMKAGDAFIGMFTYNACHEWYDPNFPNSLQMATVYSVPIESDIDLRAQYSESLYGVTLPTVETNINSSRVQDKASSFDGYTQTDDAYLYNTAYSITPDLDSWKTATKTEGETNNYDVRIHNSQEKENNEAIDNWLLFKAVDFIDVDTRYGAITGLKAFRNRLIFWQDQATGVVATNEQSIVKDQDSNQIILGSANILSRYDYFTTIYGQKANQYNHTSSDATLYWWDEHNKEILGYSEGSAVAPLCTLKQIKNYINKHSVNTLPQLVYNRKYKEIICNVVGTQSIAYNEQIEAFTSVYTYTPLFYCDVNGETYTTIQAGGKIYKENTSTDNVAQWNELDATPTIQYVVNANSQHNKTFDIQTFGGRFYGGDNLSNLSFTYKTPLKQESRLSGSESNYTGVSNREYDFRLNIPRAGHTVNSVWKTEEYGDRMRGKTMLCEIKSNSNNLDFSLQYVTTKFRMSWT